MQMMIYDHNHAKFKILCFFIYIARKMVSTAHASVMYNDLLNRYNVFEVQYTLSEFDQTTQTVVNVL
jgi:hypothetical protein